MGLFGRGNDGDDAQKQQQQQQLSPAAADAETPPPPPFLPPASRRGENQKSAALLGGDNDDDDAFAARRAGSAVLGDEWRAKTEQELDPAPLPPRRRRLLLVACLCILGNEICERMAFYAVSTNMGLYLKKELGYPTDKASQLLQAWKGTVFLTPLIGAYLADAVLGRFWVILLFSLAYLAGLLALTLANALPALKPVGGAPPPGAPTVAIFWAAMYMMALGAGGIKPCVSSFGADQFDERSARERSWRASFFNWLYASINVGSLVATIAVVPVQETKGYGVGFAIPTAAMAVSLLCFLAGWPIYTIFPPQGSPFARLFRVLRGAARNRKLPLPADASELYEEAEDVEEEKKLAAGSGSIGGGVGKPAAAPASVEEEEEEKGEGESAAFAAKKESRDRGLFGRKKKTKNNKEGEAARRLELAERLPHTQGMAFLDKAAIRGAHAHGRSATAITVSVVEESKAFYRIMPIFLLVIVYQMAYDPIFTLLPYPGDVMDRRIGSSGAMIPASSISFANTFGVLLTIPFYDLCLVPLMARLKRPITVTQRIGAGFAIEVLALLSAGAIESIRYKQAAPVRALYEADGGGPDTKSPDPLDPKYSQPMSIWVQVVPYYLLGASEAFTNVGVMELFYCGVSTGMRSIGTACYLLTVALGTYLATALNLVVAAATRGNGEGGWVADNSLYGHLDYYFYLNAGILLAALLVYVPVSKRYVERPVADADGDPFDREGRAHGELACVSRAWPSVSRASRVSELRLRSRSAAAAVEQASVWER